MTQAAEPPGGTDFGRRELLCQSAAVAAAATGMLGPLAAAAAPAPGHAPAKAPASPAGLPQLARGLNLSHWFEYERGQGLTAAEMRGLQVLGLDHVRIPVDPVVGGWHPLRGGPLGFLGELRGAVDMAVAAGLEVVVDLHLEPSDKARIEDRPASEDALVRLWQQMSRALADTPRRQVALELFNEPQYYGHKAARWPRLQRRLLDAVRQHAPQHLVLLSGASGGSFEGMAQLAGEAGTRDAQLAFVFHFYEPFLFTHQGTVWQDERYTTAGLRHGLRYPPEPVHDSGRPLRKPHPRAAEEMAAHLAAGWGPQRMQTEMARAGDWARQHGVRVLCNEFGCIRAQVEPASRYRWMHDVRAALETQGLGWTLWDYTDIFGITAQSNLLGQAGRRTLDEPAYAALGLRRTEAGR